MDANDMNDPAPDVTMSGTEAATYLSGVVGHDISAEWLGSLHALGRGPVTEEQDQNLVYRRPALDAFLRENGADPVQWLAGAWRNFADQFETVAAFHPELQSDELAERVERLRSRDEGDGWDPDQAR